MKNNVWYDLNHHQLGKVRETQKALKRIIETQIREMKSKRTFLGEKRGLSWRRGQIEWDRCAHPPRTELQVFLFSLQLLHPKKKKKKKPFPSENEEPKVSYSRLLTFLATTCHCQSPKRKERKKGRAFLRWRKGQLNDNIIVSFWAQRPSTWSKLVEIRSNTHF